MFKHTFFNYTANEAQNILSKSLDFEVVWLETVSSTNDLLRMQLKQKMLKSPKVILTWEQTKGRGQFDRTWHSLNKQCLMMSLCFKITKIPQNISLICGLTVIQVLAEFFPSLDIKIKYPNDIILEDKKLGGILVEIISHGANHYVIIGMGLNWFIPKHSKQFSNAIGLDESIMQLDEDNMFSLIAKILTGWHENTLLCIQHEFKYFMLIWEKSVYKKLQSFTLSNQEKIQGFYSHTIGSNIYINVDNKIVLLN